MFDLATPVRALGGYITQIHHAAKNIEAANFGKVYTNVYDNYLDAYLVQPVVRPVFTRIANNQTAAYFIVAGLFIWTILVLAHPLKPKNADNTSPASGAADDADLNLDANTRLPDSDSEGDREVEGSDHEAEIDDLDAVESGDKTDKLLSDAPAAKAAAKKADALMNAKPAPATSMGERTPPLLDSLFSDEEDAAPDAEAAPKPTAKPKAPAKRTPSAASAKPDAKPAAATPAAPAASDAKGAAPAAKPAAPAASDDKGDAPAAKPAAEPKPAAAAAAPVVGADDKSA